MTRGDLKDLIKECILEVITDGVKGGQSPAASPMRESQQRAAPARGLPPARKAIGNTVLDRPAMPHRAPAPQAHPDRIARSITSDPTLQSIFADTAATTLQEQMSAERGRPVLAGGDAASEYAAKSDPVDLFGEASANWAALAFADDVKR